MASINTGATLGGAAGARDRRLTRELEGRRLDIAEGQFKAQQDAARLQEVRERFAGLAEQAVGLVQNIPAGRDTPEFAEAIRPIREAVATLGARAEQSFPGSVSAQNQLALFDSAITATPTITEAAEAEAEATVAGASAQASAIQNLEPDQRARVEQLLGLGQEFGQEFFGLMQILEDPNSTPLMREKASERLNFISSRSAPSEFTFSTNSDGGITVRQGPAGGNAPLPPRQTLGAKDLDDLRAARDIVSRGKEIADSLIGSKTPFGALGSVRSGAQTVTGIVSDLLGIPAQELLTEFEGLLAQLPPDSEEREMFTTGAVDAAEGILTFAVARAIQGDSNRLLAGSIAAAKNMVNLTGATSDEQVRQRLDTVSTFLNSQDTNFQRRFEQGLTGTTTTEREPALETPSGEDDLINRLDTLLGGPGG